MNELQIKKVTKEKELQECLKLREIVFEKEQLVLKTIEQDQYDFLNTISEHFLIIYQNQYIGTFRILNKQKQIIQLQRFCLLKQYRRLGIGKQVLLFLENYCEEKNKKKIILDAQYQAHEFYQKCGYKIVSDLFLEAGIEHVKMEKDV